MLVDCSIGSDAGVVHLRDQVTLSQVLRRLRDSLAHLELLWLEYLTLLKTRQFVLHLFVPVEYLKPVQLLDRDSLCVEMLSAHADLHLSFC